MREIIEAFDAYLGKRGLKWEATIIGGTALLVMDVIERATQDVDCLIPRIPKEIAEAAKAFAGDYAKNHGIVLKEHWLNNGPESLARDLMVGWQERVVSLFKGKNIHLFTLGRFDFLCAKLFAFCDRQQDFQDCIALNPTSSELQQIYPWLILRDSNPLWEQHVRASFAALAEKLGYEFEAER